MVDFKVILKFLNKLCAHYWTVDADSSLWYGWQGLPLLREKVSPKNAGYLHFVLGMAWENKGNFDSTRWYLNQAERIFTDCKETRLCYRCVEQIGSLYRIMGHYDTAVVMLNKALDYFKSTGDNYQIMSTLVNIGSVYLEQNRYNKALEYYQASAAFDSILKDTTAMATHMLGIGNIYLNLGTLYKQFNPEKSDKYFSLSRQNFSICANLFLRQGHETGLCFASMNLLSAFIEEGLLQEADSLLTAHASCLSSPDSRVINSMRISQAQLFLLRGNKRKALDLLQLVSGDKDKILILPEFHEAMLSMSVLLRENGNVDSAWRLAERSLTWAKDHSVFSVAAKALNLMSQWQKSDGNPGKALTLLQEAGQYKDSLFVEIGKEIFDEFELKYKNRGLHEQITLLKTNDALKKSQFQLERVAGILALLALAFIIGFLLYRHKVILQNRKIEGINKIVSSQETTIHQTELENLRLSMQLKEQELIFQTLKNADLSQMNRSVKNKLEEFKFRFPKKKDQEDFSRVMSDIHRDVNQDPMSDFEMLFKQMHGGFYEKLFEKCQSISHSELQICALLRMNLSSKDIARLMNISSGTVDGTRSRIRKKLALDPSDSLTSHLIKLS